jgi:hypothetical protein
MTELNVGGSNMTVELRENTLYAEANTGNKQWVAVLTDTHPKYNYDRDFAAYQKPKTAARDSGTATVEDGAVIERVRYTHSGKNRKDQFFQLVDGEVYRIDEADVVAAIGGEIVADTPDDDDDGETHECEECGDEFDSEHGLAVHQGIVHSEDEEEDVSEDEEADAGEMDSDSDTRGVAVADGGLTVREFNDVRHSDELVREYRTPPGDRLYAYRGDDGEHHVVVSRGSEPGTKWESRVPATVARPVPGQKLWTIPDNWEKRVHSKRDSIAYGLFYVPEPDVWAKVSIPTNDWLTDAWYRVSVVGDLAVEPVGELASSYELRQHAREYEEKHDVEQAEKDVELLRKIADNWDMVEEDLRLTTEWVRDEGLDEMQPGDQPIRTDRDWQIEFHQDRIFKPLRALGERIDFEEYDIPARALLDELRDVGLPSHHSFELALDDSDIGMEYCVRGLIEAGASPAEAIDYCMVEVEDMTQTAWAEERGVDQSTVSGNVSQANGEFK